MTGAQPYLIIPSKQARTSYSSISSAMACIPSQYRRKCEIDRNKKTGAIYLDEPGGSRDGFSG